MIERYRQQSGAGELAQWVRYWPLIASTHACFVSLVPGNPMLSGLCRHHSYTGCIGTHAGETSILIKENNIDGFIWVIFIVYFQISKGRKIISCL